MLLAPKEHHERGRGAKRCSRLRQSTTKGGGERKGALALIKAQQRGEGSQEVLSPSTRRNKGEGESFRGAPHLTKARMRTHAHSHPIPRPSFCRTNTSNSSQNSALLGLDGPVKS
eukprot:366556-Chlamydomonas_euryale.AAC.10